MIPLLGPHDPFPPVSKALRSPNGLLCAVAVLSPARLLDAYSCGIFPWFSEGEPILWCDIFVIYHILGVQPYDAIL